MKFLPVLNPNRTSAKKLLQGGKEKSVAFGSKAPNNRRPMEE
jgi:hypothetical protein